MGILFALARRNILRNKARSALTLGAIFIGVAMTILLAGFGDGLTMLMRDDTIKSKIGALQVHRTGYSDARDNQPLDLDMEQGGALEAKIRSVAGVRAVAPRIVFSGLINNGRDATMVVGRGIDPSREYEALPWARGDVVGAAVSDAQGVGGVMGYDLANAMGLKLGGTATLQAATKTGQQNALDVDLVGTLDNANVFESKRFMHVPLGFAQKLLRMPGRVTEYAVSVDDVDAVDDVAQAMRGVLGPEYEVETWAQLQPNVADVLRFQAIVVGLIGVVFLVIVVFGVINTMAMSVLERTREIGTMMALGVRRSTISRLFVQEAAVLALVGSLLGLALGMGVEALIAAYGGIPIAPPGMTAERYHLIPATSTLKLGVVLLAAMLGAMGAAVVPAWRAAKLRPVDALRAV